MENVLEGVSLNMFNYRVSKEKKEKIMRTLLRNKWLRSF
jgi:hypothetical protein